MQALTHTMKIAIFGMESNKDKQGGPWLTYKKMLLDCIDELLDVGMSETVINQMVNNCSS